MTDSGTASSSQLLLQESLSLAGTSPADPRTPQGALGPSSAMLSVNFRTPHAGVARSERLKQMTQNHIAFQKSRHTQEILVKAQHALRRMPGVSGQEANELVSQLQEVGQIINQETTQLVDALMNVTLDQEETDKAIARMSIDANLAQARTDDQAQTISDLRVEVKTERERRERVEADAEQVLKRLQTVGEELNRVKDAVKEREEAASPDDLVKSLVENLRLMDRRTLSAAPAWLQEQRQSRAANSRQQDKQAAQPGALAETAKTPVTTGAGGHDALVARGGGSSSALADTATGPVRVSPAFPPMARTPTAAPPKFGPLQSGPPRAPAAMSHERRFQGAWAGPSRSCSTGATGGFMASSAFSNPPRKGGFQPLPRYRPNGGADYHNHHQHHHHWPGFETPQECGRPASSYGPRREYYPSTPTSGGRSRYGRFADTPVASGPASSSALVSCGSVAGPPIHLTERAIAAWNEQVMDFYGTIRRFVSRHASEPDHDMTQVRHSSLWPVVLAMHHPLSESEAASYLGFHLRNENSKACVVTRVVDYVVNRVWVPGAWTGSDSRTTYDLVDLERGLDAAQGQPAAARQPLLDQQASIISHILRHEQGTAWHRRKTDDIARALLATVRPLLNRFAAPAEAHRDLDRVAEMAWELSSQMLCSRLTFDFRFPDIGARFSSQSMLPIWPRMDPADLQAKHWRVAFVTTPAITCRSDTGGSISAHSVSLADVLCMQ